MVKKIPVERETLIPRFQRPISTKDDQTGDEISYSISPCSLRWESLSQTEKAEPLDDNLETQFQPVTDTSVAKDIEIFDVKLRSYFLNPASEQILTNSDENYEAIMYL